MILPGRLALAFFCCVTVLAVPAPGAEAAARVAPRIFQTTAPIFPLALEADGPSQGEVQVAIKISAKGRLEDLLVTAYTRKPFADEVIKAIKTWKFEPGSIDGHPTNWVRILEFKFRSGAGELVTRSVEPRSLLTVADDRFEYRVCTLGELDHMPVPVHLVTPEGTLQRDSGPVVVEFYIDEQGRVRLPVVTEGHDIGFGNAAQAAVAQWQFDPPTRKGIPVLVSASQTFQGKPEVAPPSP